ncbi:tRNA (adenosine(37)-N6)-dimethylallyltransferase MiaA [Patescibacteria group bacterium]|nr:tRNA (adenosine(37)-N6)-dimethylallyltransferase MiaA [Patescibacteria group bacterium]MBU1029103.1 tRNA (adenosine(37)-N6)-dimethylallyltransferase MiaA [Patescibacteria group bacterium]MBU1916227.1 tRNA (adenosine(37)-N6)-dimethylallyltransferase MiaA [Patescibacteria group bacterium]
MRKGKPKAIVIVGPTASGKTSLAIQLAREFNGEIVSADSRQLYRGTDICTDIPSGKWRAFKRRRAYLVGGVPHYLLNSESPARPITVSEYRRRAVWRLREIASRGKLPFLVGGTGLYIRAVVDNFLIPAVEPQPKIRAKLECSSTVKLYSTLRRLDPEYAARISPGNRRYIIRALEVIKITGKPFSAQQKIQTPQFDWFQIGVDRPRQLLYSRIDQRVEQMVERGLLKETERLARRYGWSAQIMSSLGYKQLHDFFIGKISLADALNLIKRDTRHYARRQLTWLRRDNRVKWVDSATKVRLLITQFLKQT